MKLLDGFLFLMPHKLVQYFTFYGSVLSAVGSAVGIASGVNSLMGGGGGGNVAGGAYYDPYGAYRKKAATTLNNLLYGFQPTTYKDSYTDPITGKKVTVKNTLPGQSVESYVMSTPGYAGGMRQGENTLNRTLAARGLTSSGQEQLALQDFGFNYFNQAYDKLINRFTQLSGANTNPLDMTPANSLANQQQQAGWQAVGQGLAGLNSFFNSNSSSSTPMGYQSGGYGGSMTSTPASSGGFSWGTNP